MKGNPKKDNKLLILDNNLIIIYLILN